MKFMIKTTTLNDLVLYVYNENGLLDADRIQRSIDGDPLIREEFNEIIETLNMLNEVELEPSEKSIEKILAFSRATKS